jgi:glycosyltransferase involved in cell wall biosynthesis
MPQFRFLIDATDLRFPHQNKYKRVTEALIREAAEAGGVAVELSHCGRLMYADNADTEKDRHPIDREANIGQPSLKRKFHALKLLAKCWGANAASLRLSEKRKLRFAWELASNFEALSPRQRGYVFDFLTTDSDAGIRRQLDHWLSERDFDELAPLGFEQERAFTPTAGDILILPGAGWRSDLTWLAQSRRKSGLKLAFLIYDLLPLDYPSVVTTEQRDAFIHYLCDVGRNADVIFVPNAAVAARLIGFFESKKLQSTATITTIRLSGAALHASEETLTPRLISAGIADREFLLCVSALRERKHVLWLYALCAKLRDETPGFPLLVLAGSAADVRILEILTKDPGWGETAVFVEDPTDQELAWLYRHTRLCLQPSFEGGTGLALMEARENGCSCIAADHPTLFEAGGNDSIHYLPRDEFLWETAMLKIIDDESARPRPQHRVLDKPEALLPKFASALGLSKQMDEAAESPVVFEIDGLAAEKQSPHNPA